jgi:hypothetical protein
MKAIRFAMPAHAEIVKPFLLKRCTRLEDVATRPALAAIDPSA